MKRYFFRQFISSIMIGAVLLGTVVPLCACLCECCYRENGRTCEIAKIDRDLSILDTKNTGWRAKNNSGINCRCVLAQRFVAIVPITVSQVKQLNSCPSWDIVVSIPSFDQVDTMCLSSFLKERRGSLCSHVPLHVLLCVFLN